MEERLTLHEAAVYQIRFQGALDNSWFAYLHAGLTVQVNDECPQCVVTTLVGKVSDQAALLGLLNSLYYLGLPLLLVKRIG